MVLNQRVARGEGCLIPSLRPYSPSFLFALSLPTCHPPHVIHLISLPSFAPLIVSPPVSHPLPFFLPLHLFHHCLPSFSLFSSLSFLLPHLFTFPRHVPKSRGPSEGLRPCAEFSLSEPAKLLMIPRTWNPRNHEVLLRRSPVFVWPSGLAVTCGRWSCGRGSQHHSCCNTTLSVARNHLGAACQEWFRFFFF